MSTPEPTSTPEPMTAELLPPIADTLQYWLDWDQRRNGVDLPDDKYIMAVPHWPSRGQLKTWIAIMRRTATAEREAAAARADMERLRLALTLIEVTAEAALNGEPS